MRSKPVDQNIRCIIGISSKIQNQYLRQALLYRHRQRKTATRHNQCILTAALLYITTTFPWTTTARRNKKNSK